MKVDLNCEYRPGLKIFQVSIVIPDVYESTVDIPEADFNDFVVAFHESPMLAEASPTTIETINLLFQREKQVAAMLSEV